MEEKKQKQRQKKRFDDTALAQDIRYRGPLSYRHFRILGWLCIALSQVAIVLSLAQNAAPEMFGNLSVLKEILSSISSLSVPFLLLANFAPILDHRDGLKNRLLVNGAAAGGILLLYLLLYYRYFIDAVSVFTEDRATAISMINGLASDLGGGIPMFNFFVDLFLCTLVMFFLNTRPKRVFVGKKLLIFRLFTIFPIGYEIASLTLQILAILGKIHIPVGTYAFFTTKPPITFLVFLVLVVFIKTRERRFRKNGKSHSEYMAFLNTRRNSLQFSKFTALVLLIAGCLDFIALVVIGFVLGTSEGLIMTVSSAASLEAAITSAINIALQIGIGKSVLLIPMAPLVLLFSYTRIYKNKMIDILIPIGGVALIIFIYLEGFHAGIGYLPELLAEL